MSRPFPTRRPAPCRLSLVLLALGAAAPAGAAPRPAEFVPDLEAQFAALNVRADALGLDITTTPDPSSCKHYQSIVRVQGPDGTPFMIMTRSGNTPSFGYVPDGWLCDDSPGETGHGNLIVFRMDSRDKDGERLRSNRLEKGTQVDDTRPDPADRATKFYTTTQFGLVFRDGTSEDPATRVYGHPGGMQVVGNILAVALETPYSDRSPESLVMFIDVTNPESPDVRSSYAPVNVLEQPISAAGTLGIARMPDGHFLMVISGGKNNTLVHFFRSNSTDLASRTLDWTPLHMWVANVNTGALVPEICELAVPGSTMDSSKNCLSPDEQYLGQNWPDGNGKFTHQTLQLLREGSIDGTLYLAGARGRFLSDDTDIDLYRVDCDTPSCDSGPIRLKHVRSKSLSPRPVGGGEKLVSFAAATGFYVSPSGELLLYGAEHDNDGPAGTVKAGEWRNVSGVRPGSPTLLPTASLAAPGTVDEGSTAPVTGTASGPTTRAFLQLFHQTNYGSFSLIADYRDRDRDDFDNLYLYELQILPLQNPPVFQHSDKARSWIWHAPAGCSIRALDREIVGGAAVPDEARTLTEAPGEAPAIRFAPDLSLEPNDGGTDDINAEIDGIAFQPDCDDYYSTPFSLSWDLDGNGSFEGAGSPATFSAASLDGPSVVTVTARSQSPYGGAAGTATATVTIANVAPRITDFVLRDGLGNRVGIDVPFAILGLPLTAAGSFVDPGRPDTQTARLDWGDGTVEANGLFDRFQDAFGGRTGEFGRTRRYAAAGDYVVTLGVADDDDGAATAQAFVAVLSPAEAVAELVATLDGKIATAPGPGALKALNKARLHLAGGAGGLGANGALDKLSAELRRAAIAKLQLALGALEDARVAGADVGTEILVLRLVLASLRAA